MSLNGVVEEVPAQEESSELDISSQITPLSVSGKGVPASKPNTHSS